MCAGSTLPAAIRTSQHVLVRCACSRRLVVLSGRLPDLGVGHPKYLSSNGLETPCARKFRPRPGPSAGRPVPILRFCSSLPINPSIWILLPSHRARRLGYCRMSSRNPFCQKGLCELAGRQSQPCSLTSEDGTAQASRLEHPAYDGYSNAAAAWIHPGRSPFA